MKTHDFIRVNIGERVYIDGSGDLAMCGEFRKLIREETELTLLKLTKGGNAYVVDDNGTFYSIKPKNINLVCDKKN